jgi:hypothetical protein
MNLDRPTSPDQTETPTTTWEDDDVPSALSDPLVPVGWRDCDDAPRALDILDGDETAGP